MPRLRPLVTPLPASVGVPELLDAWRDLPGLVALDSAHGEPGWNGGASRRWSLVGVNPLAGEAVARDLAGVRRLATSLLPDGGDEVPGPFAGGFMGALSYDLGVEGERQDLPPDPWECPPVVGGVYVDFAVLDHQTGRAWLVLGDEPGDGRPGVDERRESLLRHLARPPQATSSQEVRVAGPLERHTTAAEHERRVEVARSWIAQGEFYQVNLAQRFTRRVQGHPVDLYRRLRAANPGAYHAYLAWGPKPWPAGALLSTSPELLLTSTAGALRTRPIKGTIARCAGEALDARAVEALLQSPKERAELAMIVDLERNDLGRVSTPGSVRAEGFPEVESYRTLHHLVADVHGTLRPGLDGGDALAAVFPGGSVTGAPKLRAMQAIADLEGEGRGFFTGSAGFLDHRGDASWSVLIRTAVWRARAGVGIGEVSLHVGGGITWASDPAAEERETRLKGAALAAALAGEGLEGESLGIDLPG